MMELSDWKALDFAISCSSLVVMDLTCDLTAAHHKNKPCNSPRINKARRS
jgi:hypothetical protein